MSEYGYCEDEDRDRRSQTALMDFLRAELARAWVVLGDAQLCSSSQVFERSARYAEVNSLLKTVCSFEGLVSDAGARYGLRGLIEDLETAVKRSAP